MIRLTVAYIATALVFLALDAGWITVMGPKLYRPAIGELLSDTVRIGPAILFYFMFVGGLLYFCVAPNLDGAWTRAAISGAVLGLIAYGTYDLTCASTMKVWSTQLTIADMAWGAFACAAASSGGVLITRFFIRTQGA